MGDDDSCVLNQSVVLVLRLDIESACYLKVGKKLIVEVNRSSMHQIPGACFGLLYGTICRLQVVLIGELSHNIPHHVFPMSRTVDGPIGKLVFIELFFATTRNEISYQLPNSCSTPLSTSHRLTRRGVTAAVMSAICRHLGPEGSLSATEKG